jgi:hypothetical protein
MRFKIAAALLLIASAPAAAQRSENPLAALGLKVVEPMSAAELAKTKSRIAADLARSGNAAFFDDISDQNGGRVRHRASGLVCLLGKKGQLISQRRGPAPTSRLIARCAF